MARGDGTIEPLTTATMASRADLESGLLPQPVEQDKVLPLPGWLVKVYFIFRLFCTCGRDFQLLCLLPTASPRRKPTSWSDRLIGCGPSSVGARRHGVLPSVLAPWHWGQGHHIQRSSAAWCVIATASLTCETAWPIAARSKAPSPFQTDDWANSIWPSWPPPHQPDADSRRRAPAVLGAVLPWVSRRSPAAACGRFRSRTRSGMCACSSSPSSRPARRD